MRRLGTVLLCAAALVAGCGSDDEQAEPASEGTPTPSQEREGDGYSY